MPAFTPFLNLYKPGGGSTGTILPDEVADIDRLNQNFDLIDSWSAAWGSAGDQNIQLYGPAANLSGITGMKFGDTYQESDGSQKLWKFDGSNWVTGENGMYLIRPTSVFGTGVSVDNNGHTIVTSPGGTTLRINGVFTSRFTKYRVEAWWGADGSASGAYMRFCAGESPVLNTGYFVQNSATVASAVSASFASATNTPGAVAVSSINHAASYLFSNPASSSIFTSVRGESADYNSGNGLSNIMVWNTTAAAHDGFELVMSVASRTFGTADIAVYGLS